MIGWWCTLFTLGILAFLDSFYDFGQVFRQMNSSIFLLVSLGLLFRITHKIRQRTKERFAARIDELESELQNAGGLKERVPLEPPVSAHQTVGV